MSSAALCSAERRVESACVSVDKPLAALVDYGCVNLSLEPACCLAPRAWCMYGPLSDLPTCVCARRRVCVCLWARADAIERVASGRNGVDSTAIILELAAAAIAAFPRRLCRPPRPPERVRAPPSSRTEHARALCTLQPP